MKIRTYFFAIVATLAIIAAWPKKAASQQYKLRQVTNMMSMKSETTIYVKGMRKRTEGGGYAGSNNNLYTIEQCDLQRTISVNDKKRLYYVDPFSKESENIVFEQERNEKTKTEATTVSAPVQKGGVITMWNNITDTGERKKMYGIIARHVWTTQKIKPSADACMKDSMLIKTDGWYIDLPEFICPVRQTAAYAGGPALAGGCRDKYITKQTGKGKLGFPLIEKRTMIMGDGKTQSNTFETDLETIEFSTAKLDSMLFEIPAGYTLAKDMNELYEQVDAASIIANYSRANKGQTNNSIASAHNKKPGAIRIGILEPAGPEQLESSNLQQFITSKLTGNNVDAIAVTSIDQAKELKCDLILQSHVNRVKQSSKVGGLLKAVRNVDPYAASTYNIDVRFVLLNVKDGSIQAEKTTSGKFEGSAEAAIKKALAEGSMTIVDEL